MHMIKNDDRTHDQKATHHWAVVARDKFLSGWGGARGGASRCAWTCDSLEAAKKAFQWVSRRSDMCNVTIEDLRKYRAPSGTAHFHIYVVDSPNHPAIR